MTRIYTLLFCLAFVFSTSAQQLAVTEDGDEVFLYENGTWKYKEKDIETEIPTNPIVFTKDNASTFLIKSSKLNVGFWINPKLWTFKKAVDNPDAEFELQFKSGDLYGMIISEKFEIPLESLKNIALENGRAVAPDLAIYKEEYRNVNGLKVLLLQMNGTMQGIKFSYYGYYYSSTQGTVQFITYTSQNLLNNFISESEKILNGIVEIK
jgi:hypothetical protein